MDKIKVIITDDHKMFREGISNILSDSKDIEIIAEAGSGEDLIQKMAKKKADVILMDINLPGINGIEVTKIIKKKYPKTQILALSTSDDENYIIQMVNSGALGYILKSTGIEELIAAIKTLSNGDSYFCKEASAAILGQMNKTKKEKKHSHDPDIPLSDREIEVLKLISRGMKNKDIAGQLFISVRTVDTHRRNIHQKLNINNTAGLINYAIKAGLYEVSK